MGSQILLLMTSISTIIDVLKVSKVSIFRTETPFYFRMPLNLEFVKMCKQTPNGIFDYSNIPESEAF